MIHGDGKARLLDAAAGVIETSVREVFPELDRRKARGAAAPADGPPRAQASPRAVPGDGTPARRRRSDREAPR